jgi:hypothetical protein
MMTSPISFAPMHSIQPHSILTSCCRGQHTLLTHSLAPSSTVATPRSVPANHRRSSTQSVLNNSRFPPNAKGTQVPRPSKEMFRPTFQTIRKVDISATRYQARTSSATSRRFLHSGSRPIRSTLHPYFSPNQRRSINLSFDRLPSPVSFCLRLTISAIAGITALGGVILIHDAFTYQDRHVDRVPTNPLSLHPRLGGPKGLPIVEVPFGQTEDILGHKKPKLVIVGGGWGVSLEKPLT